MKRQTFIFGLFAAAILLAGCGGDAGTQKSSEPLAVKTVTFFKDDGKGGNGPGVKSFVTTDNPLHAAVELSRLEVNAKVRVAWMAVGADNGKDVQIADKSFDGLAFNKIDVNVSLPRAWPVGAYRLDVYVNEKLIHSEPFKIDA